MLKNIDINFEKFIEYSSKLKAIYNNKVVLKKDSLGNTKRKYISYGGIRLNKIGSKGKGK